MLVVDGLFRVFKSVRVISDQAFEAALRSLTVLSQTVIKGG